MAMEISDRYGFDYISKAQTGQTAIAAERAGEAAKSKEKDKPEMIPTPKDEYISSEKSGKKPSGLYHMEQDENGNQKIIFVTAKREEAESEQPKVKSGRREDDAEEVTGNTDAVDREIEKLKKKKQQLEQQIRKASGDEEKTKELEEKLAQVESELAQKDNDTYRRQHAVVTSRA